MLDSPVGEVGRYVARKTRLVAAAASVEAPRSEPTPTNPPNPRHMADNIMPSVEVSPLRGQVYLPHPALFVVRGTRPHRIEPRGLGYPLRFYWKKKGRIVYFSYVNHPGTGPNNFALRALRQGLARR